MTTRIAGRSKPFTWLTKGVTLVPSLMFHDMTVISLTSLPGGICKHTSPSWPPVTKTTTVTSNLNSSFTAVTQVHILQKQSNQHHLQEAVTKTFCHYSTTEILCTRVQLFELSKRTGVHKHRILASFLCWKVCCHDCAHYFIAGFQKHTTCKTSSDVKSHIHFLSTHSFQTAQTFSLKLSKAIQCFYGNIPTI